MIDRTPRSFSLVPYTADSPLLDIALEVYARVWPARDRTDARENITRCAGYQDFHGLVAMLDDAPVGVGYGARSYAGVWWNDQVVARLRAAHPALQDAWRLVELAVVEEWRGHGLVGQLHDALLTAAAQCCSRALLSATVANPRARQLYECRGWHDICENFDLASELQPYVIMGIELTPTG